MGLTARSSRETGAVGLARVVTGRRRPRPGCPDGDVEVLGLAEQLDEIAGIGAVNGRAVIAELGTDPSQFPTPGHAAGWARLTPRSQQSGESAKPGRTGKGNRYLRRARAGRDDRS